MSTYIERMYATIYRIFLGLSFYNNPNITYVRVFQTETHLFAGFSSVRVCADITETSYSGFSDDMLGLRAGQLDWSKFNSFRLCEAE